MASSSQVEGGISLEELAVSLPLRLGGRRLRVSSDIDAFIGGENIEGVHLWNTSFFLVKRWQNHLLRRSVKQAL